VKIWINLLKKIYLNAQSQVVLNASTEEAIDSKFEKNDSDPEEGSRTPDSQDNDTESDSAFEKKETLWKPGLMSFTTTPPQATTEPQFGTRLFTRLEAATQKVSIQTLLLVGQYVWGGCGDVTLAVWDIRTGTKIGCRQAHKGRIFSMLLVGDKVWTGSDDNKIRIWNLHVSLFKEVPNIFRVSCLMEYLNDIWCGSLDSCIRIIDSKTFKVKKELAVGLSIRHLFKYRSQVWICTDENVIRINAETYVGVDTLEGARINCIVNAGGTRIWGCSSDSTIRCWNADTGELVRTIRGHSGHVFSLLAINNFVWSGGWDKSIKIWNARTFQLVSELKGNNDVVSSMILVRNKLDIPKQNKDNRSQKSKPKNFNCVVKEIYSAWSGAWDGTICVWV